MIFIVLTPVFSQDTGRIMDLLNSQTQGLEQLVNDFEEIKIIAADALRDNQVMREFVDNAERDVLYLHHSLDAALRRVDDAEDGAVTLLNENWDLWNENRQFKLTNAEQRAKIAELRLMIVGLFIAIGGYVALRILKVIPKTRPFFFWVP